MSRFDIRAAGERQLVRFLSGGNQQKVVLARELHRRPGLLVAVQPTRGLDIGATDYVHRQILKARDEGAAVVLVSTDLQEILQLSDRFCVIHVGRKMGEFQPGEVGLETIGLLMAGHEAR